MEFEPFPPEIFSPLDRLEKENYDSNITYGVTSIGITTEELERCDEYTKMFIYITAQVIAVIPVPKTRADTLRQVREKIEEFTVREHQRPLTVEEQAEKKKWEDVIKDFDLIFTPEAVYQKVTYKPYLNNLFFKVTKKANAKLDTNGTYVTLDNDKKKWVYKTWVFTNVRENEHTIHFMDRTNRPGLVEYKNIEDITFAALNIPRSVKGVFVVKDSVLARPNFKEVGLEKITGLPYRQLGNIKKLQTSIAGADALYANSNSTLYYNNLFSPILRPNTVNSRNILENIDKTVYKDTYMKVGDNPATTPYIKSTFINNCVKNGIPIAFESANLFEGGIDGKYLMDQLASGDPQDKIAIRRWRSIVKSHYDNHNMVLMLNKDTGFQPGEYDQFLRQYVGKVSNYVIKDPKYPEEIEVAKPYSHNSELYMDLNSEFSGLPREETWKLSAMPHLYSDVLRLEEELSGQAMNGNKVTECREILNGLKETRQEMFNHNGYTNGLSFEDIIFIPIEKILSNGGEYYDEDTDLVIVVDDVKSSESVIHPFSKKKREIDQRHLAFEADNIGTGCNIKIISSSPQEIGKVYYTKFLNKVYNIPVTNGNGQASQIIITSRSTNSGLPEITVLPLTEQVLKELNLFDNINDAECLGLREENLKREGYSIKLAELQTSKEITQMNLEKARKEFETYLKKTATELAAKKLEFELKLKDAIAKSMLDEKINNAKLQKEKYSALASVFKSILDTFNITTRFVDIVADIIKRDDI